MIILHKRAVILLTTSEVSALRIKTLAKNEILNVAPWATVNSLSLPPSPPFDSPHLLLSLGSFNMALS